MGMSGMKEKLKLDYCSHEAAKYSVENWHYSRCLPVGKLVKIGVWEDSVFVGCIIFSRGANNNIGRPYHLEQNEVCELTRVALNRHKSAVTRMLSIAFKMLLKICPTIQLVVSFADHGQGHYGKIYQAGNWVYCGLNNRQYYSIHNKLVHPRSVYGKYQTNKIGWIKENIDKEAKLILCDEKYKYLMPLSSEMKIFCEKLRKPYPKCVNSVKVAHLESI